MPHYRINIKLENEPVKEYIIEDQRTQIDFVYLDYRQRVYKKNGAGRVIYFDLVMLAEESLKHQDDRKEVYKEENNYRIIEYPKTSRQPIPKRRPYFEKPTLAERMKK